MTKYQFAIQLTQPSGQSKKGKTGKTSNYSAEQIYKKIEILEGSVLGKTPTDLKVSKRINDKTALVDAAGKDYMIGVTVEGAGESAGALYEYIGLKIKNNDNNAKTIYRSTPDAVKTYFNKHETGAFLQEYDVPSIGKRSVIHAVGPKLAELLKVDHPINEKTHDDVRITLLVKGLTPIYKEIFEIFCNSNLEELRLIPISTGLFAEGIMDNPQYKEEKAILMQQITCISILHALYQMNKKNIHKLYDHINLCIWIIKPAHYRKSQSDALEWYNKNMGLLRGGALNFHSVKHKKKRKYSNINKAKLVKRTLRKRNTFSKYA